MFIEDTNRRVVITGMGATSALGSTLEELWRAARDGICAVRSTTENETYPTTHVAPIDSFQGKIQDFGELDDSKKKAIRKGIKLMSREIQLGVASAQRAIADASLDGQYPSARVGVSFASDYIVTTPQELIDAIAACRKESEDGEEVFDGSHWRENGLSKMTPLWQLKYLTNMVASHITIYNEFLGPAFDMTNREASFSAALGDAAETIKSGRADAMIVGATGSRVHPYRIIEAIKNGEIAPEIVKGVGTGGDGVSRPFDARRTGAIPGEGAGAVALETLEAAQKRGAKIYAEVCGGVYRGVFKRAKDCPSAAVNPTETPRDLALTAEGAREAIRLTLARLVEKCGVSLDSIGHISANARGDVALDSAEALALRDVFGAKLDDIPVCALKGATGNPGAGGGAIETIASVLALQNGTLYPTLGYETPDPNCPVAPVRESGILAGDSFIKICANSLGQASAALIRKL
ncbi:MAG: beta-ketoacyl-[Thermoguttaceae bacterium]|nr:beta-ketoacyl-[acyl-carrier-protein] synthase family protein [Thermoguttaceae bacterium]